jgi:tRNA threonylcarbamoyladenosine biosynthesis protein TsaB
VELAIDTSTVTAGVALARHGQTQAEMTWRAGYNHTAQLMPAVDHLLRQAGVTAKQLDAIVVATGPGSFSGLRVGVSAAKALAESLGIALAGVGTMHVEAYPFVPWGLPVCVLLDAGRGELAIGTFQPSRSVNSWPAEAAPPRVVSLDEVCAAVKERTLFCGEQLPAIQEALASRLREAAVFPPAGMLVRRPAHLAALGWRRLARGERDDPATLQPLYLRGPSITKPAPAHAVKH